MTIFEINLRLGITKNFVIRSMPIAHLNKNDKVLIYNLHQHNIYEKLNLAKWLL